jgi:hypothetical protein
MAALMVPAQSFAQWIDYVPAGTPRLKNGKVNLSAPTPRALDGKPDLTGVWAHEKSTLEDFKRLLGPDYDPAKQTTLIGMENEVVHKYGFNILIDFKPEEVRLTPEGEALMKRKASERNVENVCHGEYGWPVLGLLAEPIKLVQAPKETVILYEIDHEHRQIFVDGRQFPKDFQLPAYLGYSVGRWEGDTFIVETRGFNDRTPLDAVGHPRSEAMHVTEKYRRRDYGHLESELTFDDPKIYTKPFTVKINYELVPNNDIFEMFCGENEKDRTHMVKP